MTAAPQATDLARQLLLRGRSTLAGLPGLEPEGSSRGLALTGQEVPLSASEPFHWTSQVCRSASELRTTLQWSGGLSGGLDPVPLLRARQCCFRIPAHNGLQCVRGGATPAGGGKTGNTPLPLEWQAAPDQVVLGVNGRGAAELDSLRAVIATFEPLLWKPVRPEEDP